MGKLKLLFLSANLSSGRLKSGTELREIDEQIRQGLNSEIFEIVSALAVRTTDLQQILLRERPQLVHFSGHGAEQRGIMLENEAGRPAAVSGETLAGLFRIAGRPIRVVFLNACESVTTTEAFSSIVDYTIAMRCPITDRGAIVFAKAFYRAISHRISVPDAFALGINELMIERIPETDVPRLTIRPGAQDQFQAAPTEPPEPRHGREGKVVVKGKGKNFVMNTKVR